LHDSVVELFRARPELVVGLLSGALGYAVPEHAGVRLASNDLNDYKPTEYTADAVIILTDPNGAAVLAVIVEAQLRPDPGKRWAWPAYLASLQARLRCPVVLVVVSPTIDYAADYAAPLATGHPGYVLRPLVIGPEQLTPITDAAQAQHDPELAVLSALAHRDHPQFERIFLTLVTALDHAKHERAGLYTDMVLASCPPAVQQCLEELMATQTYEYQSNFARRYYTQGEAKGRAEGEARGEAKGRAEGEATGRAKGEAKGRAEGEARAVLAILPAASRYPRTSTPESPPAPTWTNSTPGSAEPPPPPPSTTYSPGRLNGRPEPLGAFTYAELRSRN
jgi:hypothetical protein